MKSSIRMRCIILLTPVDWFLIVGNTAQRQAFRHKFITGFCRCQKTNEVNMDQNHLKWKSFIWSSGLLTPWWTTLWCCLAVPYVEVHTPDFHIFNLECFSCDTRMLRYRWAVLSDGNPNPSLLFQDYPSLALLGEKLAENNIFLIFAVTKRLYVIYKVLWIFVYTS